MKNCILLISFVFYSCLTSCISVSHDLIKNHSTDIFGTSYCKNAEYVATEAVRNSNYQPDYTLSAVLSDVKKRHGKDVTVANVRWDIKETSFFGLKSVNKMGIVYDVIKCK